MSNHKKAALAGGVILVVLDQLIKQWALASLPGNPITVIPGLFKLSYVENRGAAFGLFQGGTVALGLVSAAVLIALLVYMLRAKLERPWLIWSLGLILAGGVGNLIDRFTRGFVVDYLDFSALFNFPVFNMADCCVVCGTAMVLIYVIFIEGREKQEPAAEEPGEEPPDAPPENPTGDQA